MKSAGLAGYVLIHLHHIVGTAANSQIAGWFPQRRLGQRISRMMRRPRLDLVVIHSQNELAVAFLSSFPMINMRDGCAESSELRYSGVS